MTRLYAIAAVALVTTQVQASLVLGNLDSTTPGAALLFGSTTSITDTQAKTVTFEVGTATHLGSVFLALSNFDDLDVFDIFIGTFNSGTVTPVAALGLTAPVRTTSNNAQVWQFDYFDTPDYLLNPGITYALTLTGGRRTSYTWGQVGSTGIMPTGAATFGAYYFSDNSGVSYSLSTDTNLKNSFSIQDSLVPAPAPIVLFPVALAWLAGRRQRRG